MYAQVGTTLTLCLQGSSCMQCWDRHLLACSNCLTRQSSQRARDMHGAEGTHSHCFHWLGVGRMLMQSCHYALAPQEASESLHQA